MNNIIIPTPTSYEITYVDAKKNESQRKIVPITQTKDDVRAYCYKSHGIRTFKKSGITAITSVG
jgi:predicted DNA-binding transcriptional regulator YafY